MRNRIFRNWMRGHRATLVLIMMFCSATVATAENWIAAGGGFWNTPGNWNPATVPSGGDTVTITPADGVARTVTYDYTGAAVTLAELRVDLTDAGSAATTLSMSANNLTSLADTSATTAAAHATTAAARIRLPRGPVTLTSASSPVRRAPTTSAALALVANTSEYIGDTAPAFFNQTGGTNTINGAGNHLYLGYNANASPRAARTRSAQALWPLTTATSTSATTVWARSTRRAVRTSATSPAPVSIVGLNAGSTGTYNQTGGTNTVGNSLYVGVGTGSTGTYTLGGTGILSARTESIGDRGVGTFNQTGGTNTVTNELFLGFNGGSGTYTLSAGALSADTETIGATGNSIFNHTGGTNSVRILFVYNGAYTLSGGTLRLDSYVRDSSATFNFFAGTIQLTGDRAIGTDTAIQDLFGAAPRSRPAKV